MTSGKILATVVGVAADLVPVVLAQPVLNPGQGRLGGQRGQHGGDLEGVGTSRVQAVLRPADA